MALEFQLEKTLNVESSLGRSVGDWNISKKRGLFVGFHRGAKTLSGCLSVISN